MKPLRVVHFVFGVLVFVLLVFLAGALLFIPFQNAEISRGEGLERCLQRELAKYHNATGHYPSTLTALTFADSNDANLLRPRLRKVSYRATVSGYFLSFKGWWYCFTLSISDNGVREASTMTARFR